MSCSRVFVPEEHKIGNLSLCVSMIVKRHIPIKNSHVIFFSDSKLTQTEVGKGLVMTDFVRFIPAEPKRIVSLGQFDAAPLVTTPLNAPHKRRKDEN